MQWSFICKTGLPCVARFDGAILEVEVDDRADFEIPDDFDDEEEAYGVTDLLISDSGLARTHCASLEIARRELRMLGAEV